MSQGCYLCQREMSDESSNKKCKKLYGRSAEKSHRVLESVSMKERQVGLDRFVEISNRDVFLCYGCDAELCKVESLRDQLEKASSAVSSKLLSLHTFTSRPNFVG